jgi:hypothetical protein
MASLQSTSVTGNLVASGILEGSTLKKTGGTGSQFLKADGTVDSSAYITGITSGMVTTALGYTPVQPNGTGASGTWGISISGSAGSATTWNGLNFNGLSTRFTGDLNTLGLSGASGIYNIGAGYTNGPSGNLYGTLFGIWNTDISVQFWPTYNGDFYWRKSVGGTYTGSTWRTILDSSNYNSYSPTLTGGGASGTWGINITGNAATVTNGLTTSNYTSYTLPIGGSWYGSGLPGSRWNGLSVSGGEIVFGNGLPNAGQMGILIDGCYVAGENNGYWSMNGTNTWGSRRGWYWDGTYLNFTTNSAIALFSDVRAPIFYDSDNTSYYLDPAGTSNIRKTNIVAIGQSWDDGLNLYSADATNRWNVLVDNGASDMLRFAFNNAEKFRVQTDGVVIATGDFRAPIFYDSANTSYYGDFASISSMYGVAVRGDTSSTDTNNQIFFWGAGNTTTSAIGFKANGGYFTNPTGAGDGYNTYFTMDTAGRGWVFRRGVGGSDFGAAYTAGWILNNGIWQANDSMRAPIFYDSNDTTYYADFNNTGRSMYTAGYLQSSGMIMKGSASAGAFGGQIYPTVSYGGVSIYGGNNLTNGAYFTVTGIDYGSSPGAGSAEFVIRDTATSKFAMYSYNGSTYTGRYSLWGSTGNVTIGSATTDYGYRLYVLGDIYATGNVTAYSDARVKTNIREIENPLDRVLKSRGVVYDRIDIESNDNIGFIAQELEEQFPELVSTDKEGRKGVMYQNMVAVLLEAVKEQQKKIDKLENLINGSSN